MAAEMSIFSLNVVQDADDGSGLPDEAAAQAGKAGKELSVL
jgi:hypothetical protein